MESLAAGRLAERSKAKELETMPNFMGRLDDPLEGKFRGGIQVKDQPPGTSGSPGAQFPG